MTSRFEELVVTVQACLETLTKSRNLTAQAATTLSNAAATFADVSRGATSFQFAETLQTLTAAIEALRRAETVKTSALKQVGEYLTEIGAPDTLMTHPSIREPIPELPATTTRSRSFKEQAPEIAKRLGLVADTRKQFFGAALTAEQVHDFLQLLPARNGRMTSAAWIGEDGELEEIISGKHDIAYEQAQQYWRVLWKRVNPTNPSWDAPMASHVEVKAAIQMRVQKLKHRSIVINHLGGPCGNDLGCQKTLDKFIPQGSTLTVYWPGGYRIFGGKE